jgi:DNA-binding HxlR family transcriptional regulator
MIRLFEVLLHAGTTVGGWSTKQIHESVIGRFGLKEQTYPMSSLSYDLRKLKGHGLVERDRGRYRYRLTEKGQRAAVLFLMFHQRLCGPLAGSQFGHRPNELHRPKISKLEQAYYEADRAIDKIVTMLKAA